MDIKNMKTIIFLLLSIFLFNGCASKSSKYIDISLLSTEERATFNQKVFDKVWSLVNENYYDPAFNGKNWILLGEKYRDEAINADSNNILYDAINKMLDELNSSHLEAIMTARIDENMLGPFEEPVAAGFIYHFFEDKAIVTTVFPDSLAKKAGIQKGWLLIKIKDDAPHINKNGETTGESAYKIPILDVGKSESYVFLDQEGQEHSIELIPAKGDENLSKWLINPYDKNYEPIITDELTGGYLYLLIKNFRSWNVIKSIKSKLDAHTNAPGVILDLRLNKGGNEWYMKTVLGLFFKNNIDGGSIERRSKKIREIKIHGSDSACTKPIIILINSNTECAAEMFAHVIKFYNRGTIIGRPSKGNVQGAKNYFLPGGGLLHLPELVYIGLDSVKIDSLGIPPDVVVPEPTLVSVSAGRDLDLEAALHILNEKN